MLPCRRDMAENFRTQILNSKGESSSLQTPVRTLGSCTFMYLRHSDLYILMVTKNNANVMMAFKFMTSVSSSRDQASLHYAAAQLGANAATCLYLDISGYQQCRETSRWVLLCMSEH